MKSIKISEADFNKIKPILNVRNDNSMELIFHQLDLENVYFDEEKDDFVKTNKNLLEFDNYVVEILNSCGLTDEFIREIYHNFEGYNVRFDKTMFKFKFEIQNDTTTVKQA